MKLKDKDLQPAIADLPVSYREWWDIGDGYEIYVAFGKNECLISVYRKGQGDITLQVARLLGIETRIEDISFKPPNNNAELYLVLGIDCVGIEYTKPKNYKEFLYKIETIVNENFKNK